MERNVRKKYGSSASAPRAAAVEPAASATKSACDILIPPASGETATQRYRNNLDRLPQCSPLTPTPSPRWGEGLSVKLCELFLNRPYVHGASFSRRQATWYGFRANSPSAGRATGAGVASLPPPVVADPASLGAQDRTFTKSETNTYSATISARCPKSSTMEY